MQINAISSVKFKGESEKYNDFRNVLNDLDTDVNEIQKVYDKTKSFQNSDEFINNNNDQEVTDKSTIGKIVSVMGAFLIGYAVAKKSSQGITKLKDFLCKNNKIQDFCNATNETLSKKVNKLDTKIVDGFNKLKNKIDDTKFNSVLKSGIKKVISVPENITLNFISKTPQDKLTAVGTVAAGTGIITADTNGDGKSDILQNGINAYKALLQKGKFVSDILEIIS